MKTLEEVIRDLKAQCDTKASAVADLLEDMRYNVECKDFEIEDCADNVADMGEWGNYAAEQLRGKTKEKKANKPEKINGLMDVMRGMYDTPKQDSWLKQNKRMAAAAPEMYAVLLEVEAHSRMRRPIKKATWLKVCAILKQCDGVYR